MNIYSKCLPQHQHNIKSEEKLDNFIILYLYGMFNVDNVRAGGCM